MGKLNYIRSLPCAACYSLPRSQAAHSRIGTDGGIAYKPDDKWTLPLCHECHHKQHQIGEVAFYGELIERVKMLCLSLDSEFNGKRDWGQGVKLVLDFRRLYVTKDNG